MQTIRKISLLSLTIIALLLSSCSLINGEGPDGEDLEKLEGIWFRVLSNNPANDGLELTMIGNTGTISDNPRGGFDVGDVKWRDITPTGRDTYDYEELGSDGAYYPASMILDGDTVRVTIQSSGAGNVQKWVKEAGYTEPVAQTTVLDCSGINSATTWTNTAAEVDYIVPSGCVIDITEDLTIEAGTTIQFEENSGLGVYDNGSLKAIGSSAQPITLEGTTSSRGYWRGIHIETNTIDNQLDYVSINDAGSNYVYCCNTVASLFLKGGKLSIKNSEIRNGEGYGLYANKGAEFAEFENVTIDTHKEHPMILHMERASELDGTGSDFSGNDEDFVFLFDSRIDQATTIKALNVPYLLEGEVFDIAEALTIEAGAELAFEENGGIGVFDNGSLNIQGTSSNAVTLRGKEAVKGFWRGIHIETNSSSNQFTYAEISDAGGEYVFCCNTVASVFLKDGQLSISNSTISNGKEYGIATKKDAEFSGFSGNTITTHGDHPMYISGVQAGQLDGLGSDYQGNDDDYILIYRDQVNEATTFKKTNVPYRIDNNVVLDVTEALTLEPGVDISFSQNAGLGVYDNGSLNAEGTSGDRISFRGVEGTKGFWRGIHTETNSSKNVLDFVNISDAASNYVYCCNVRAGLLVKSGSITVSNSNILDNDGCGISVNANGTLTESGNTFSNNTDGNICN